MKKLAKIAVAVMAASMLLIGCNKKTGGSAAITKENLKVGFVYIGFCVGSGNPSFHRFRLQDFLAHSRHVDCASSQRTFCISGAVPPEPNHRIS